MAPLVVPSAKLRSGEPYAPALSQELRSVFASRTNRLLPSLPSNHTWLFKSFLKCAVSLTVILSMAFPDVCHFDWWNSLQRNQHGVRNLVIYSVNQKYLSSQWKSYAVPWKLTRLSDYQILTVTWRFHVGTAFSLQQLSAGSGSAGLIFVIFGTPLHYLGL